MPPPSSPTLEALKQLERDREKLAEERRRTEALRGGAVTDDVTRAKLRGQIADLLRQLEKRRLAKAPAVPTAPTVPTEVIPPVTAPSPVSDPITLAETLIRGGQYAAALTTLRAVNLNLLSGRDRLWVQYLMATCQRRLGDITRATALYRQIANSQNEDAFLAETARWQLSMLTLRDEVQSALRDSKAKTP